jgi:hypothetical protein
VKIVFEANDIVLAKLSADLHFNYFHRNFPGIFQPMRRTNRDKN